MPHKLMFETRSPNEKATVMMRCVAAKEAGVIQDFSHYTDWGKGREQFTITYPDRDSDEH